MTAALKPAADWYIDQLAEHGWLTALGIQAGLLLAAWCVLDAALRRRRQYCERRDGIRRLQSYANHPANHTRKEDRP
ncbi:hypothetical protein ABZ725_14115 [Streptomyces sp. NPDC006872]|uniref:hypothetical protein n=1 Tax=Streptomyces sp. NPDC006872 TaxID=3155720 RepID=UPI0033C32A6A